MDNPARTNDSRDARTWQGASPQGDSVRPEQGTGWAADAASAEPVDDPVGAVNPGASPSSFTIEDIDEGDTPLDEGMDMLIDPSLGTERLSNNRDVLDLDRSFIQESEEP